jgi:ribosomal protein S6--L-glutamate ligase
VHLTILSRSTSIYTTRRLVEAARDRGFGVRVVDPLDVEMGLGEGGPVARWRGKKLPRTDVVIPRVGRSIHQYGLAVVNQLELVGLPMVNGSWGIAASRNKLRCLQLLAAEGVPVPRTVMASNPSGLKDLVRIVGGTPVMVKLLATNGRSGVMICESLQSLEAALEAILGLGQNIVVQQYLRGRGARDLRAIVVGGQVVAAMRRDAQVGKLSKDLRRGAHFEPVELRASDVGIAVEAARILQLQVCAVDILDVSGGAHVFEVNASPSIREAETVCGVDVAGRIADLAATLAKGAGAGTRRAPRPARRRRA